jgi:DNA gyrase subunit A
MSSLTPRQKITPINIEDEMRTSYIDYSMSVIVSRALPDVRDGLKPSQRRILVAMNDLNLTPGRPYRKCAKIAGDTSGNYHPHGEQVVYPTLVRMAQDFNLRYMLVDGQGNFGSIDGDQPAAMRYTEARLTPMTVEILGDLDKNTVEFRSNYDETREEPGVLPAVVPNLLINGSSGIAVGMATEIPPHNLSEVADAIAKVIDDPDTPDEVLLDIVKGPDFPTGAIIYGQQGIQDCYTTGRGLMRVRARVNTEEGRNNRMSLVVTEIPFQVNKANLLEKIANLVKAGRLEGISDLRDESDREGMRIVIELKRDAQPKVVLNQLFRYTPLQTTFGAILLALVDGRPQILTLRGLVDEYIKHRRQVVRRRTEFDLEQAEKRAHILEGYKIALDNIDAVIELIKKSKDTEAARTGLMKTFGLSEIQANAILDMRLARLTGLEREKIEKEYLETIKLIEELRSILASMPKMMGIIKKEILKIKKKFGDERRTEIVPDLGDISIEDLIQDEDMVVTISHAGYIKRNPVSLYRSQRRGGKGIIGAKTKEEDWVEHLFVATMHSYLLFLTSRGRCYWLKVHEIDQASRAAKGRPIVNLIEMDREDPVQAVVPVREFDESHFLVLATRKGLVKKTVLSAYGRPRRSGINAILLDEGDKLIEAVVTDGTQDIILGKAGGKAIRFHEREVRGMGRTTRGVTGIKLEKDDKVVSMVAVKRDATLLAVTENGYGKRSSISEYRVSHRAGYGVITIKTTDRNGLVVAVKEVVDGEELMVITRQGQVIRMPVSDTRVMGRNTQGVRLVNLDPGDQATDVARVVREDVAPQSEEAASEPGGPSGNGSGDNPAEEPPDASAADDAPESNGGDETKREK